MRKHLLAFLSALIAVTASAPARAQSETLPTARLVSSFAYDELYQRLKAEPLLQNLNKDQYGSPILLRVTHALIPTTAGAASGLASAVWAGGTLGLLPVVENKDLEITYDLYVNETLIASYSYQKNFTSAKNIYSKDTTQGLGGEGQTWALQTASQFSADARSNPKIAELIAEYRYYFGASIP
ncbi:hypothetical protein [Hydrocarboniphaga sp.]|uniref:hypothetical protein n=1 Tax=Hydrocarboniphaga sp. TaxID=2033016 RepID=UPI003D09E9A9